MTIVSPGSGLTLVRGPGRLSTSQTSHCSLAGSPVATIDTEPSIRFSVAVPLARVNVLESAFQ